MIWLDVFTIPASLLATGALLLSKRGRRKITDRFGEWNLPEGQYLWFHAASAGEVKGIVAVLKDLKQDPDCPKILLTTTSATGLDLPCAADEKRLLPFDVSFCIGRAINGVDVKACIFTETEIWPVLLRCLHSRHIPYIWVNARISNSTLNTYKKLRWLLKHNLARATYIATGEDRSRDRFISLGANPSNISVLGSSKADFELPAEAPLVKERFWKDSAPIMVFASIRPGEEKLIIDSIIRLRRFDHDIRIIFAPRHLEKVSFFEDAFRAAHLETIRYSQKAKPAPSEIVLIDTIGDLASIFGITQGAFIGGSIVPVGGHNPLEPAFFSVPIAMGVHTENVYDVVESLVAKDALTVIRHEEDLFRFMLALVKRSPELAAAGKRANEVLALNRGASGRIIDLIRDRLLCEKREEGINLSSPPRIK